MAAGTAILVGMAVSTAISAYGSYKAGKAGQKAAESDAQRLEFNADIADAQAEDALERGVEEESRFRQNVRRLVGTQRASFAGQGVAVNVGSARDVREDTNYLAELDAAQIQQNAEREAWGHRVEAQDLRMQADVSRKGGKAVASAGKWNAAGTVVGGTTSLLMTRYGFQQNAKAA